MNAPERPSAAGERSMSAPGSGWRSGLWDRLSVRALISRKSVNKAAYVRIRSEIDAARPEFEQLVDRTGAEEASWVESGRDSLDLAEAALRRSSIGEAWRHLHTAKRFEVYGLELLDHAGDGDAQRSPLEIRAAVNRERALDTLEGWRRRAVVDLLCDEDESLRDGVSGSELRSAARILHEYHESVYLLRAERQRQFNQLTALGTLSGLSLFVLTLTDWLLAGSSGVLGVVADFLETPFGAGEIAITDPGFAVFMTIVGVMGASLFGMRTLRTQTGASKIPQQINQFTITSVRAVIGAISALLFYFVLQTPLLRDGTILAEGAITAPMMVVIGFAAGYTERMAPNVVSSVASITESGAADGSDGG